MLVRPSREADVEAIAAIYAHHVLRGLASFETEPPPPEEIARRRADVVARALPHLVADADGLVVGFAYAAPYRTRPAYRFTLEDSIYVHPERVGQGVGRRLLPAVIGACERGGYRQMVAVIGDSGNVASIRLHEAFGFRRVGLLPSVGYKLGRWVDSVLMQRPLGEGDATPPGPGAPAG